MKKKLIGIPGWSQGSESFGVTKPYLEYIKQYGTAVVLSPDTFIENLDLLFLPGGKDLINGNSSDFSFYNSAGEAFLEWFDANTLRHYIDSGTSVWGTCRGMQSIMKYFGAPLIQHIWWDHGDSKDENDLKAHKIIYTNKITKEVWDNAEINLPKEIESFHHQGVFVSDLPEDFELLACSAEANKELRLVEYARHKTLPIVVKQGHSERSFDELSDYLIKGLLEKSPITV